MRLALYEGEGVPEGTPQDLTGLTVVVRVLRDGTNDIYTPGFVVEGEDNNVIKFTWPADQQAVGNYTIDVTMTDGSDNVNRVNWHGKDGIRLVEYSNQVYGDDATGAESSEAVGLVGYFTTNGVGMSAFDEWRGSEYSEGYPQTVAGFMAYLKQPATDAANAARQQMQQIQSRADEDHTRAGNDHSTAESDHTRAGNDHTRAEGDHTTAADDHRIAAADHVTAGDDHTLAAADHVTAFADHGTASDDHTLAAADHRQANLDHVRAEKDQDTAADDHILAAADHTQADNDHTLAASDHGTAADDHTLAVADHGTAGDDHTTAVADHGIAAADHTQAVADHGVMSGYDTRLTAVEGEVTQLGQDLSGKADKDTDAEEGNVAEFDANGNPVDSGIPSAKVAMNDGSYDSMSVGMAKNLEGRTNATDSFLERTTGGDAEVANGLGQLMGVAGRSVKWNQLVASYTASHCSASESDGIVTITPSDSSNRYRACRVGGETIPVVSGHKYYQSVIIKSDGTHGVGFQNYSETNSGIAFSDKVTSSDFVRLSKVGTATNSVSLYVQLCSGSNTVYYIRKNSFIFIDLTAIFGSGNEPATVEAFEEWIAKNVGFLPYYPYDAGAVLNNKMTGVESLGFNLLDPATGKAQILGAYSDVYGNYYGITGTHGALTFTAWDGTTSTITPDSDGKFLLEVPGELSVASAGADCAVFFWWDGTKTEYEDYDRNVANLDVTHIYGKLNGEGDLVQVWPTGMPAIGGLKDTLKIEDGAVVARRVLGAAALADREFTALGNATYPHRFVCNFNAMKANSTKTLLARYENKGTGGAGTGLSGDKQYNINGVRVAIRDDSYEETAAGVAAFNAALNGLYFYYELATPEVYTDLVYQNSSLFADGTPVTLPVNYKVDNFGVERAIPQNSTASVFCTGPELSIRYGIDAVEQLDTLQDGAIMVGDLKANLQAMLTVVNAQLEATMGGTIVIGDTPTDKVYPFSFVPTPEPTPEENNNE